jgi:hypothetical protein
MQGNHPAARTPPVARNVRRTSLMTTVTATESFPRQ